MGNKHSKTPARTKKKYGNEYEFYCNADIAVSPVAKKRIRQQCPSNPVPTTMQINTPASIFRVIHIY